MNKKLITAIIIVSIASLAWLGYVQAHRSIIGQTLLAIFAPKLISSHYLSHGLSSDNPILVANTLDVYRHIENDGALEEAKQLLHNPHLNIWMTAAQYCGHFGQTEAVPYLIKGLNTAFYGIYPDLQKALETLTGESFGDDYNKWKAWWISKHPNIDFDFEQNLGTPREDAQRQ